MTAFLSPIINGTQIFKDDGTVNVGGLVYTYLAGTTTPATTWTKSDQTVQNSNPIVLNSAGRPPQEIWLQAQQPYKFVVTDAAIVPLNPGTYDNISGVNDVTLAAGTFSSWATGTTPTLISSSSFSVAGNQTTTYITGLRLKFYTTAGIVYGTIMTSVYTTLTTVTMSMDDSQVLDSGLSAVFYSNVLPLATSGTVPAGTILMWAGLSAPNGYVQCPVASGGAQLVSRTLFAALFAALGTTWGAGDGSTTFGIPWFPSGYGGVHDITGISNQTTGSVISHTHGTTDPGHTHGHTDPGHNHASLNGSFAGTTGTGSVGYASYANGASPTTAIATTGITNTSSVTGISVNATGGSVNLTAGVTIMYCVKY